MAKKAAIKKDDKIEVVFSFDTTGSMFPCLAQVRETIKENVTRLFEEIPNIRIGLIAHGDYCDAGSTYVTKHLDLTDDVNQIYKFVNTVGSTGGGDAAECYELVLNEARTKMSWTSGKSKVLAMIGDDVPHGPTESQNAKKLNWRNELGLLLEAGINVYGVQALDRSHATSFYKEIADRTGGFHITLDQFENAVDLISAICYKQVGDTQLIEFEKRVIKEKRMNRNLDEAFRTLLKRAPSGRFVARGLDVVPLGRFQAMKVKKDSTIRDFVESHGIPFVKGRGFYQFTKSEDVQDYKEIILKDKNTGDMFVGARARILLGLPGTGTVRIRPSHLDKYVPYVQSTSVNRKLIGGTEFLYEVDLHR